MYTFVCQLISVAGSRRNRSERNYARGESDLSDSELENLLVNMDTSSVPRSTNVSRAEVSQRPPLETEFSTDSEVTFHTNDAQSRLGANTAKYLDDPQSYFASLETEDTVKCVASSVMFLVLIFALLIIMFLYNPQM